MATSNSPDVSSSTGRHHPPLRRKTPSPQARPPRKCPRCYLADSLGALQYLILGRGAWARARASLCRGIDAHSSRAPPFALRGRHFELL